MNNNNEFVRLESRKFLTSKWILLMALVQTTFLADMIKGSEQSSLNTNSNEKYRLCGDKLVKVLSVVCRGCFEGGFLNAPDVGKRSEYSNVINWIMHQKGLDKSLDPPPDQAISGAAPLSKRRQKRGQSGIVDECCIKQCSYSHLRTYCSNDCPWVQQ